MDTRICFTLTECNKIVIPLLLIIIHIFLVTHSISTPPLLVQVLKIAILAEKFAEDYTWYVDTILNLIRLAGDYVSEEVWYRIIQIVINRQDVQGYAAKTCFEVCVCVCVCIYAYAQAYMYIACNHGMDLSLSHTHIHTRTVIASSSLS